MRRFAWANRSLVLRSHNTRFLDPGLAWTPPVSDKAPRLTLRANPAKQSRIRSILHLATIGAALVFLHTMRMMVCSRRSPQTQRPKSVAGCMKLARLRSPPPVPVAGALCITSCAGAASKLSLPWERRFRASNHCRFRDLAGSASRIEEGHGSR